MKEQIIQIVDELENQLISLRRDFHMHPELSGQEYETAKKVLNILLEIGLDAKILDTKVGPGVIAILKGENKGPTIAFRADMDALPLQDKKQVSYKSTVAGVMHACGHDFNMTSILGLAMTLSKMKDQLNGSIKFIFQPSEESATGGAESLLDFNIMDDVKAIWTIHALPDLEVNKIGIRYGAITSATDAFKITVIGKSGHSARPYDSVDAIYISNQILNGLYSFIQRRFDPRLALALSVGRIEAGSAPNIIAGSAEIEGTARMFDQKMRSEMPNLMSSMVKDIAKSFGAEAKLDYHFGPPPVINDEELAKITEECTKNLLGDESMVIINRPSMGAEDFSRYLWYAPGMLIRIGTGGEYSSYPLHSSLFNIDEKAIASTVKLLAYMTTQYFKKN